MTDLQLYLAIGVPVIANATMLLILQQSFHRQLDALKDDMNRRLGDIIQRLDRIERKLDDHEDRIVRLEERTSPIRR
jgi:hypothetical protein